MNVMLDKNKLQELEKVRGVLIKNMRGIDVYTQYIAYKIDFPFMIVKFNDTLSERSFYCYTRISDLKTHIRAYNYDSKEMIKRTPYMTLEEIALNKELLQCPELYGFIMIEYR